MPVRVPTLNLGNFDASVGTQANLGSAIGGNTGPGLDAQAIKLLTPALKIAVASGNTKFFDNLNVPQSLPNLGVLVNASRQAAIGVQQKNTRNAELTQAQTAASEFSTKSALDEQVTAKRKRIAGKGQAFLDESNLAGFEQFRQSLLPGERKAFDLDLGVPQKPNNEFGGAFGDGQSTSQEPIIPEQPKGLNRAEVNARLAERNKLAQIDNPSEADSTKLASLEISLEDAGVVFPDNASQDSTGDSSGKRSSGVTDILQEDGSVLRVTILNGEEVSTKRLGADKPIAKELQARRKEETAKARKILVTTKVELGNNIFRAINEARRQGKKGTVTITDSQGNPLEVDLSKSVKENVRSLVLSALNPDDVPVVKEAIQKDRADAVAGRFIFALSKATRLGDKTPVLTTLNQFNPDDQELLFRNKEIRKLVGENVNKAKPNGEQSASIKNIKAQLFADLKSGEITKEQFDADSKALKQLSGPSVVVNNNVGKPSAKDFALSKATIADINEVEKLLFDENGKVNRGLLLNANTLAIDLFGDGNARTLDSLLDNIVASKLRSETGAATNESEIKNVQKRFRPSIKDSDQTIKNKLKRLKAFAQTTIDLALTPQQKKQFLLDVADELEKKFPDDASASRDTKENDLSNQSDEQLLNQLNSK